MTRPNFNGNLTIIVVQSHFQIVIGDKPWSVVYEGEIHTSFESEQQIYQALGQALTQELNNEQKRN